MKTIARIISTLVVLAIVVPVIAVGIFFATFDEKAFRSQVTHQVSDALGREVAVDGPIGLSLHDGIALSLKQIRIGNPAGFAEKEFAKAGALFVSLNWQALLMRKVDISRISLADASASLITNASGQNNWDFPMGEKKPVAKPAGKPEANMVDEVAAAAREGRAPDFSVNSVALNNVELTNVSVKQVDQRSGKKQEFLVDHALLKIPASGAFHGEGKALVNGSPFEMRLDTKKSLREVREGTPIPLDMHLSYGGQDYDLKGNLSYKGKTYRFDQLEAKAFSTNFTGTLQADLSGAVPYVSGDISSPEVDLTKLAPTHADNGQPLATPIAAGAAPNLAVLRSFNSDLGFATPRLMANANMVFENINTRIKVNNGVLRLDPAKATYQGIPWAGEISADEDATIHVALRATNVDYATLAQGFGAKAPVDSKGDISFDLTGKGLTPQAFMATLSGKAEITSGAGNIDWNGGNGLGGAMMKTLLPASASEKAKLTCAAMRFEAQDGILHSKGFLLESNYATVGGEGSVNLKNQSVDMLLRPVPKSATTVTSLTSATPIRVSGPLNNLSYFPQADAVLERAVGGLLSPGQKVSTGVPRVDPKASGNACLAALNNPQPIMMDPPDTKQVIKDLGKTYKGIGDAIKDPGKGLGALLGGGSQPAAAPAPSATPAAAPAVAPAPAAAPAAKQPSKEEKAIDTLKGLFGK